jgi:hypothetical protein
MPESEETQLEFNIGEASSDRDEVARYVMRLSMALGDLRVAGEYAVREDQPDHERLYFVRLFASHMREAVLVLDPPIAVLFQPSRTSSPRCRSTGAGRSGPSSGPGDG